MVSESQKRRTHSGIRLPSWALALIGLGILGLIVGSSIWLFRIVRDQAMAAGNITNPDFSSVVEPVANQTPVMADAPAVIVSENGEPVVPEIVVNSTDPCSGNDRDTILMMGIDQRCEEDGPSHTDTLMVVTIDPVGKTAAVLSLPRDLWVDIPGFGLDRINQANYLGDVYEYPGGGQVAWK
jgi:hypothetical protein